MEKILEFKPTDKGDWYKNIEEPVRGLVWRLRNNGINTISSCGHEMYVQADLIPDYQLQTMHKIVYNWLAEMKKPINYTITIHLAVDKGILSQCFADIKIGATMPTDKGELN